MISISALSSASRRSRAENAKNALGTEGIGDIEACFAMTSARSKRPPQESRCKGLEGQEPSDQ
jgi:hypothetical protein